MIDTHGTHKKNYCQAVVFSLKYISLFCWKTQIQFFNSSMYLVFPFPSLPEATQIMHCVISSSYSICFIETNSSRKRNLVRSHLADWCSLLTAQYFHMKERSGETPFQVKAYVHHVQPSSLLGKFSKETYVEISLAYRCLLAWNFSV